MHTEKPEKHRTMGRKKENENTLFPLAEISLCQENWNVDLVRT